MHSRSKGSKNNLHIDIDINKWNPTNRNKKWELMVWCAADANSYYIFDLDVYYGRTMQILEVGKTYHVVVNSMHNVVSNFVLRIVNKEHVIVIDNFFRTVE